MTRHLTASAINNLRAEDAPAHDWYRFVLSYPPHLVRDYAARFALDAGVTLLDPFCGTGTTLVEAKKLGIPSVGTEALPMAHLAASTKVDWTVDPEKLASHAALVAEKALFALELDGVPDEPSIAAREEAPLRALPPESMRLLLNGSLSPLPMHKTLVLLDALAGEHDDSFANYERVALATALVRTIGNLRFGPEVGVGKQKADAAVVAPWLDRVRTMASDLRLLQTLADAPATVHLADARDVASVLPPESVDAVITSPPYPNEKDYTRTVRLESVLLGLMCDRAGLREAKQQLVRSNTRGVYAADTDDQWVEQHPEIQRIADTIERRRVELGKTSGFERQYHRVTKLYFGGMARHFLSLSKVLKPGARLAYVVGDQASYLRVMIKTGQLLAGIAEAVGYEVEDIDLFRTRIATATGEQLREEVLLLRWPGRT